MLENLDFADIKPSALNMVVLLLMIIIIVPVAKVTFSRIYIPGFSDLILMI